MELMDMKIMTSILKEEDKRVSDRYLIYHCRYIIFTAESRNDRSIFI